MWNRKYKCPICGKEYDTLEEMYNCAQICDANIKEKEKSEKREVSEKVILEKYNELKSMIAAYSKEFPGYSYEIVLKHNGLTLSAKPENKETSKYNETFAKFLNENDCVPPLNFNSKSSNDNLEEMLKKTLGIEEPKKKETNKNISKDKMRKDIDKMVTDKDVEFISKIFGNINREEIINELTKLAEDLQSLGLPWE